MCEVWVVVDGCDVKVKATDDNGNEKTGKTHVDGALEGLVMLLLAFLLTAIMFALAFLGAWLIPIIIAACAIIILITAALLISNQGKIVKGIEDAFNQGMEDNDGQTRLNIPAKDAEDGFDFVL